MGVILMYSPGDLHTWSTLFFMTYEELYEENKRLKQENERLLFLLEEVRHSKKSTGEK